MISAVNVFGLTRGRQWVFVLGLELVILEDLEVLIAF
jgi:hypothetical protein